jgi:hypothetical protein
MIMIIRNQVIETLKVSPLNSRRSERPADNRCGVITTLKGSPVFMGDHHLNRRATPSGSMNRLLFYPQVVPTYGY